jgi:hypothetical protein
MGNASALPASHEAMYCGATSASSNRLLENDAQPLVRRLRCTLWTDTNNLGREVAKWRVGG